MPENARVNATLAFFTLAKYIAKSHNIPGSSVKS
jgi:hypothetical protein